MYQCVLVLVLVYQCVCVSVLVCVCVCGDSYKYCTACSHMVVHGKGVLAGCADDGRRPCVCDEREARQQHCVKTELSDRFG